MEIPKEEYPTEVTKEKDSIKEYEEELIKIIVEELSGDKSLLRKLSAKLVGIHHHGEDLLISLNADDKFKNLAEKISEFQENWQEDHLNWTYSYTDWGNVQWLGEALGKFLKETYNKK